MKKCTKTLKDASAHVGASRIYFICYLIELEFNKGNYNNMMEYYPCLVEAAIEYKTKYRIIIAQHLGKPFKPRKHYL